MVRNGTRGMLWLEPLVEVETDSGRVGYGPVQPDDVADLVAAGMLDGEPNQLYLGVVDDLPWMRDQQRLCLARVGVTDPLSPEDYVAHGGLAGLRRAFELGPEAVVAEVTESGLRGRGGAGFPAGIKWKTVADCAGELKFVCCNADEGDSGTFADRIVMEGDPFCLLEGMTIAAYAVGATEGYIYLRSEYPDAAAVTAHGDRDRPRAGLAGPEHPRLRLRLRHPPARRRRRLHLRRRDLDAGEPGGQARAWSGPSRRSRRSPACSASRPWSTTCSPWSACRPILADGGEAYAELGVERSRGTQVFQLAGNIARGGVFETAFGISLAELVNDYGGGTRSGRPVRAVQVGGPLGAYIPADQLDLPTDYEAFAAADAMLGHGGIVVFDDTVDMAAMARFAMEFCAEESCGKCTPCRVGSVRGVETIDQIVGGSDDSDPDANLALLNDLCDLMTDGSLCAMGGLTPNPVRSALLHFPEDFTARTRKETR